MLSNIQLESLCKSLELPLRAVVSKDELPHVLPLDGCYIINLQNSDDGDGTHWTGLVIQSPNAFYFDSFGAPLIEAEKFVRRKQNVKRFAFNNFIVQDLDSKSCGFFVVGLFLYLKRKRGDFFDKCNRYVDLFGEDTKANENILSSLYQGYSNIPIIAKFLKRKRLH